MSQTRARREPTGRELVDEILSDDRRRKFRARLVVDVQRVGLGYRSLAEDVELRFDHIHDGRDGLHGELSVRWSKPVNGRGEHILWGAWNLSSLAARNSTAKLLAARTPDEDGFDWAELLERFAVAVLALHREGNKVVTIGGPVHLREPTQP